MMFVHFFVIAGLFVSTSESESFWNVLVEAMICGIPVIGARSGGPEEIIDNGVNGKLIEIGDIEGLEKNIEIILSNDDIRNKYIYNGYIKIQDFDITHIYF